RDQIAGLLGCHDASHTRNADHVALLGVTINDGSKSFGRHANETFGDRRALGIRLGTDVNHVGLAFGIQMGKAVFSVRHHSLAQAAAARPSRLRVAPATSCWRMRLSPTRKLRMRTFSIRLQSSWVKMPLSPMIIRSMGTSGARRSEVASVVSNVRRLRLLTP